MYKPLILIISNVVGMIDSVEFCHINQVNFICMGILSADTFDDTFL